MNFAWDIAEFVEKAVGCCMKLLLVFVETRSLELGLQGIKFLD